jgi:hypothetical protein
MRHVLMSLLGVAVAPFAFTVMAQTAQEALGPAAVEPLMGQEPPAKIIIDPPLAGSLAQGRVVIQYRVENLHIVPVFGPAAVTVSPRIGHVHVSVDDAPWVWVNASGEPLVLNGLSPGRHKVLLQLETANHQLLDQGSVTFSLPEPAASGPGAPQGTIQMYGTEATEPVQKQPAAKIIIDQPLAEPLSRGVLFLQYRAENLQIVPVFGSAALAVSPRIGHVHITVDDAAWHWADSSGNPVIINGLAPGPHKILIQLVNANHQPLDHGIVNFVIPAGTKSHSNH